MSTPIQMVRFTGRQDKREHSRPQPTNATNVAENFMEKNYDNLIFKGVTYKNYLRNQFVSPFFEGKGTKLNIEV